LILSAYQIISARPGAARREYRPMTRRVTENMKSFRKILFLVHLTVGATVATVVVIMSVTGVLLTYQKQMTAWADRRAAQAGPPTPGASALPVETVLERASAAAGDVPTAVTVRSRPDAPVEVSFGAQRRELVSAYTGELLGGGSTGIRSFFRVVTAWHRTLGATGDGRARGKWLTGAANLGFLFLVASGIYLWWPRNWSPASLRNVTWFRRRLSGKARDFNWHNVIGLWTAIPLFFVVLGAVPISFRWASDLVYWVAGDTQPAVTPAAVPPGPPDDSPLSFVGIDGVLAAARGHSPDWRTLAVTIPHASAKTVSISIDRGMGGQPHLRSTLVLDRATETVTRHEVFAAQSAGRRLRSILRFAHTGEVLGPIGQTIAGLASLGAVVLAWTGIALSLRRFAGWRSRRAWARESAEGDAESVQTAA
jgi:uncharacterized iron-regulated membrane protein